MKLLKTSTLRIVGYQAMLAMAMLSLIVGWCRSLRAKDQAATAPCGETWTSGLFLNLQKTVHKYSPRSWLVRASSVWENPVIFADYLKIVFKKCPVVFDGVRTVEIASLVPLHSVKTDPPHHRQRVLAYTTGTAVDSELGPIVIVDNEIHDGHHRVAAAVEAGVEQLVAECWRSVS